MTITTYDETTQRTVDNGSDVHDANESVKFTDFDEPMLERFRAAAAVDDSIGP